MPRGDGTGPMGIGPMNASGMFGGFGCRRGGAGMMRGAGFQARNQFATQQGVQMNAMTGNARETLTKQVDYLEQQLQQVKQRLGNIDAENE